MKAENFSPFPILSSERLLLRQLQPFDKQQIFAIRSDKLNNRYIERPKTITIKDAENFIVHINVGILKADWLYWAITVRGIDTLLGTICLWNISEENNSAEIGYELHPEHHGKGYAYEALQKVIGFAFNVLKLKSIYAYTHKDNHRSVKLLEKFNFLNRAKSDTNLSELIYQLENDNFIRS